jgi:hypothetical protein
MATIIIFAIIGIIIGVVSTYDGLDYFLDFVLYLCTAFLGAVAGMAFGLLVALCLPAKTEIQMTTYKLESLQDNIGASGSFFLGTGQIEGRMIYVFYYEDDGFYRMGQVDYEMAKVKYSSENPRVEEFTKEIVKGAFINNFAINIADNPEYIIYVPKGTIKQNYSLDAQ